MECSSSNQLAVSLNDTVYIRKSAFDVLRLHDFAQDDQQQQVSSLTWNSKSTHLIVGTTKGSLYIFNIETQTIESQKSIHTQRIGCISIFKDFIATGSKDSTICISNFSTSFNKLYLNAHKQEVCGLKWSPDG